MNGSEPRSYGHFCKLAKALEHVGDRWALLVVRDLMLGPKRFTDLMDCMAGVTPKTLTRRLRDLEADGLVASAREPGRREVRYRLTPAGRDLQRALDELTRLPGVGPVLASRIVDARPYASVDDMRRVRGVGRSKLERLRELVTVTEQ